jgi:hypothetical protein
MPAWVLVNGCHERLPAAVRRVLLQHGIERRARGRKACEQRPIKGLDLQLLNLQHALSGVAQHMQMRAVCWHRIVIERQQHLRIDAVNLRFPLL